MAATSVLIVEDNNIVMLELKLRLTEMGYDVIDWASSGAEAISKAGQYRPDLILMDIRLKGEMDGIDTAAYIRKEMAIPFVYLTAHTDDGTLQRAKLTEPYGYIIKPFEERELHSTIEMALYKHAMELKLKESEHWLSATIKSIGDALIATDSNGIVKLINPVAEQITGWKCLDALGQSVNEVFKVHDNISGGLLENPVKVSLQQGTILGAVNQYLVSKDGNLTPVDFSSAPITDSKGRMSGVVLVFRDISERLKAKELIEKQHIFLRTIIDTDPNYISVKNIDGRFKLVNQATARALGTTTNEILGKTDTDFCSKADIEKLRHTDREIIERLNEIYIPEDKLIDAEGKIHLLQTFKRAIDSQDGDEKLILSVGSDITELKNTENALRESEGRVKTLLEAIPDIVLRFKGNWLLVDYHTQEQNTLFTETGAITGKNIYEILSKDLADKILYFSEISSTANQVQVFEYDYINNKDITYFEGRIVGNMLDEFIVILKDITVRKKSQLELKAINASKDKFFSIIAHDLRSPFSSLIGFSSHLAQEINNLPKEESKTIAESIAKSVKVIFNLLENLLQWSRIQTGRMAFDPELFCVKEVIDRALLLFKSNLEAKNISLVVQIDPKLAIYADKYMLETIMRNLTSNAIKFTNPKGEVTISAREEEDHVEIYVKDNGVGISEETISKLFKIDENISTYGTQHEPGSGLGLILCKEFIEINEGTLTVKSKAGEGSVFSLRLKKKEK